MSKVINPNWDDPEARRLRQLRRAEGYGSSQGAFGAKLGWTQPEISMFERGERRVPRGKVLEMHKVIPGFDPLWLTEGRREALSFDLRTRLDRHEAEDEDQDQAERATR